METQQWQDVKKVLQTILPAMQADGGGCELVYIEENIVYVRMVGACLQCPSQKLSLKIGIEKTLQQHLPWVVEVQRVL